jgi:hypothetical protein
VDNLVECPKCGFTQPDGEECIACGIVFAKYWALQQQVEGLPITTEPAPQLPVPTSPTVEEQGYDAVAGDLSAQEAPFGGLTAAQPEVEPYQLEVEPVAPLPSTASPGSAGQLLPVGQPVQAKLAGQPSPGAQPAPGAGRPSGRARHRVLRHDTRASETIGTSAMVVRTLAGLACLGIAVLMFANGKGLLSVWPYVIMVFYAGAALWGVSSFRQKITLQQFATEMALLVLVTLAMRFAAPEMFTVESPTQGTPKIVQPYLPQTALGEFSKRASLYVAAGRSVMASRDAVSKTTWDTWTSQTDLNGVKRMYSVLTTEDRARVWDVWKRVEELGPMLTDMLTRYETPEGDGVRFKAPENERATVRRELDIALIKAGQLRARLLVYPEVESVY